MEFLILNCLKPISFGVLLLMASILLHSCEKEIEIDVPAGAEQIVVEGTIETGRPPVVILSRTRGFFEPTGAADLANSYISNAAVRVNNILLDQICTDEVPVQLQEQLAELIGIAPGDFDDIRVCAYIGLDSALIGIENTRYDLEVLTGGKTVTATTYIPSIIKPDSVWFRLWANSPKYGYVFCNLSDPDTLNNAYRVATRRIGPNVNDNPTDPIFYAPLGSTFIDEFFNGETIEVGFIRGQPSNSIRETDNGAEASFFEVGDRFVFKFSCITQTSYEFYRTFESQQGTIGSPFSTPTNVISNINGGIGIWAGSACAYDTILATP